VNDTTYVVKPAPREDIGKDRIRIHYTRRNGTQRFTIMQVTAGKNSRLLCVMGHDGDKSEARMDMDLRSSFDKELEQKIELDMSPVGWSGKLRWYLFATDPAVHVPAWLGVWSFLIGMISFIPLFIDLVKWIASAC
jgi:hypothetical protein